MIIKKKKKNLHLPKILLELYQIQFKITMNYHQANLIYKIRELMMESYYLIKKLNNY